jgi:hypothetical protein
MITENAKPSEEEIADLLGQIRPSPSPKFHARMASQPWNQQPRASFWARFTPLKAGATLGLVLILTLGVAFFSPTLETLAQRLSQFFWPTSHDPAIAVLDPTATGDPLISFQLSVPEAEAQAGFAMKTPATMPEDFILTGANYDERREAIILHYTTATGTVVLRISQQYLGPDYQGIDPQAVVESAQVGPYTGEYVAGGWMIPEPEVESGLDITPKPSTTQMVWDATVKLQTLRWSDGNYLYEIILAGGAEQPGYLDKNDLIVLATQMH